MQTAANQLTARLSLPLDRILGLWEIDCGGEINTKASCGPETEGHIPKTNNPVHNAATPYRIFSKNTAPIVSATNIQAHP